MKPALSSIRTMHAWLKKYPKALKPHQWGGLVPLVVQYGSPVTEERQPGALRDFRLLMEKPDGSLIRFGGSLCRDSGRRPYVVRGWSAEQIAHVLAETGVQYEPNIPDAVEEMIVRMYAHDAPSCLPFWMEETSGPYSVLEGMGLYLDAQE